MKKSLRPENFDEYIGQPLIIEQLKTYVAATKIRRAKDSSDCALPHTIFDGAAGLGKTSIANVTALELDANLFVMQGNAIEKLGDLAKCLIQLNNGDILFIDEIHALRSNVAEGLYSAMEDFRIDIMIDDGSGAGKPINIDLPRFTLMGATTEVGRLKKPLKDRFTYAFSLQKYSDEELIQILKLNVLKLQCDEISDEAALRIASASRGTPRVALSHLRRCCDRALVENGGVVSCEVVERAFVVAGVTSDGLDANDRNYLTALSLKTRPTGLKSLSEILSIDMITIENTIEPFLHERGFIEKRANGRVITESGRAALN